jgi:diguanylate cyclase (GGDEF)-like protein/PAS domain S-box-containing protein
MKEARMGTGRSRSGAHDQWGLGAVLDSLDSAVFVGILMVDGTLVHANGAALDAIGVTLTEVIGTPFDATPWWRHSEATRQRLHAAVDAGARGEPSHFEVQIQTADERTIDADFSLHPVFDAEGNVAFLVASACDITAQRTAQESVSYLVNYDALTGLPNRRYLQRRLRLKLQRAKDEGRSLTLMCIDLDRFSRINAVLGNAGGDEVLRIVSGRIAGCLTPSDKLVRFDGDEFVVEVDAEVSNDEAAQAAAQVLLEAIAAPIEVKGREVFVTASIGVATADADQTDADVLLRNAGVALGRAKSLGRNSCVVYTQEHCDPDPHGFELEAALRHAIGRNELHLAYQPQVDMSSGQIVGVEALLRWNHPVHGSVSPARFIPIAEEAGLIGPIGDWVLRTACATASAWQRAGLQSVRMSVNISARQLQQADFAMRILQALQDAELDPRRFGVEVTESLVMQRVDEVAAQLRTLRAKGIEIALDDFGTGFSSLSCLRRLPIDVVKIDRSLVPAITASNEALSITRAIIAMAHTLGMKAHAEGIETESQLELLAANHCDRFQGHLFSAPVSADEIESMLRTGRALQVPERRRTAWVRTVLVADDERWVLDKLRQQVSWRFGDTVRVETFLDGRAAVQRLREGPVDVIISDLRMASMDGIALLGQARDIQPDAVRMMLLGPTDLGNVIDDERQVDVFRYVSKPWVQDHLLMHLQAALDYVEQGRASRALGDAIRVARYQPSPMEIELRRLEDLEPGITEVARSPRGEVLMPQSLLTLPGDLWVASAPPKPHRGGDLRISPRAP